MMVLENPTSPTANFEDPHKPQYSAFISYSHADSNIAQWLQHSIERFTIPKSLVGRETGRGHVPKKLGRCFRDRDELATSADLSSEIQAALAVSRNLIVVCSPAAAISPWVEREIVEFKKLHGAERVFALIASGEPFATPELSAKECFPRALRFQLGPDGFLSDLPAEPIAADIRPGKETRRAALLKIIAGILGVGLDELVRREAQRRRRVFAIGLGAALTVATGVGTLALVAQSQSEKARQRRTESDGMVGYMIDTLLRDVERTGRLNDVLKVLEKPKAYVENLIATDADADAWLKKSKIYTEESEIKVGKGELDGAVQSIQEAIDAQKRAAAINPRSLEILAQAAITSSSLGFVYARMRKSDLADAAFKSSIAAYEDLLSRTKDPLIDWPRGYSTTLTSLGTVYWRDGKYALAKEYFKKAHAVIEPLAKSQPSDADVQETFENALAWEADAAKALGDLTGAVTLRKTHLEAIQNRRALEPANKSLELNEISTLRAMAAIAQDRGDYSAAVDQLSTIEPKVMALWAFDPANTLVGGRVVAIQMQLAQNAILANRLPLAKTLLEKVDRTLKEQGSEKLNGYFDDTALERRFLQALWSSRKQENSTILELAAELDGQLAKDGEKFQERSLRSKTLMAEILRLGVDAAIAQKQVDQAQKYFATATRLITDIPEPRGMRLDGLLVRLQLSLNLDPEPLKAKLCSSEFRGGFEFCR
jgi:tetratricopeptide (TPR) repeat protein